MIGAGTIINPILKIVTTVAILGAVYLFIVKPTLDTTESISNRAFDASDQLQRSIQDNVRQSLQDVPADFEVEIPASAKKAQKLGDCIRAAAPDVDKIQRCTKRFSP